MQRVDWLRAKCHHTELQQASVSTRKQDVLHPANINSLSQFYATGLRLYSSEAPCCWHCNVIHFAASVILLLLLSYPAVLVDTIEGCVKWAEWNPNEGVTQYKRMTVSAVAPICRFLKKLPHIHNQVHIDVSKLSFGLCQVIWGCILTTLTNLVIRYAYTTPC